MERRQHGGGYGGRGEEGVGEDEMRKPISICTRLLRDGDAAAAESIYEFNPLAYSRDHIIGVNMGLILDTVVTFPGLPSLAGESVFNGMPWWPSTSP